MCYKITNIISQSPTKKINLNKTILFNYNFFEDPKTKIADGFPSLFVTPLNELMKSRFKIIHTSNDIKYNSFVFVFTVNVCNVFVC